VPLLSRSLIDHTEAPTPFVMGMHSSYLVDIPSNREVRFPFLCHRSCACRVVVSCRAGAGSSADLVLISGAGNGVGRFGPQPIGNDRGAARVPRTRQGYAQPPPTNTQSRFLKSGWLHFLWSLE
jgi:hypothetical protein